MSKAKSSSDPAEIFRNEWPTYKKVLDCNYMFHREIYHDLGRFLERRFASRSFSILELGCGDASQTARALANCQVSAYRGYDLSDIALKDAARNLAALHCDVRLSCAHLLSGLAESEGGYDVVFSSFALHHLTLDEKRRFFSLSHRALKDNGVLLLVDVIRAEHEDRPTYLRSYLGHLAEHWSALTEEELLSVSAHIEGNDFPETPSLYRAMAQELGFPQAQQLSQHAWHQSWCFHR